ncbi:MAG: type II toxin-antitoxin system VapC family toxin [Anaerolineae bacterium]|nr:type II toxin-antitoxin system VapC family toxin [Anaerolineae bacterium]
MENNATSVTGYFDSSALVKRYLTESGTTWVQSWCSSPQYISATAEIGLVEIAAAFAGKLRGGYITDQEYQTARLDLDLDAQNEYVLVAVTRLIIEEAIKLTEQHRLRGYDAVHLACALHLNQALIVEQLPLLIFISSDRNLLTAATAAGLSTADPNTYP